MLAHALAAQDLSIGHLDQRRAPRPMPIAHDLYSNLRALDKAGCEQILVQDVPSEEKWTAIRDRLTRGAAVGSASETDQFAETGGYSVLPCRPTASHAMAVPWLAVGKARPQQPRHHHRRRQTGFHAQEGRCTADADGSAEPADRAAEPRRSSNAEQIAAACRAESRKWWPRLAQAAQRRQRRNAPPRGGGHMPR